jgi:hypothetical protein
MMDYNSDTVNNVISDENFYECRCGGAQLQYFKSTW